MAVITDEKIVVDAGTANDAFADMGSVSHDERDSRYPRLQPS